MIKAFLGNVVRLIEFSGKEDQNKASKKIKLRHSLFDMYLQSYPSVAVFWHVFYPYFRIDEPYFDPAQD